MSNHPNMSYCMWQNTALALEQCADDLNERIERAADAEGSLEDEGERDERGDFEPLSEDEKRAMARVFRTIQNMLEAVGCEIDMCGPGPDDAALAAITPTTEEY